MREWSIVTPERLSERGGAASSRRSPASRLTGWARAMRRDVLALYLAARDPRVPWYVKALAAATAAYALSPIDLIPDFIPVLGYLDDLIVVPTAIALVVRLIPREVMSELREEASARLAQRHPRSTVGAVLVVSLWVAVGALLVWLIWFR